MREHIFELNVCECVELNAQTTLFHAWRFGSKIRLQRSGFTIKNKTM